MAEIDKDLVRWRRGQWIAVTGALFAVQFGLMLASSDKEVKASKEYPREPRVALDDGTAADRMEFLEDPFLFASANWNGFSATAWLETPEWSPPETGRRVPARFIDFAEAERITEEEAGKQPFSFVRRTKPAPVFPTPAERAAPPRVSTLRVEGLEGRKLATPLALPPQQHNDVLSPTVVETLVGPDGLVLSAVIVENSGSAKADADALATARTARFSPKPGGKKTPEVGKLKFEWIALDLTQTNEVGRNSVRTTR